MDPERPVPELPLRERSARSTDQRARALRAAPIWFERSSVGLFALALLWLLACIGPRVGSPWPLEWMEGASLEHALRLVHGRPLYAAPSADFIPFVYPPLAYLPIGLATLLVGPTLLAARCVSLIALGVSLFALVRAGRRLAGPGAGYLAAGLYALGYGYTGAFLDLARVDGVFIALVLVGSERLCAWRARDGGSAGSALGWFVLACFAKQHGVLFLLAGSACVLTSTRIAPRRSRLRDVLVAWSALAAGVALLQVWSTGWFWTYVWSVPRSHGLVPVLLASFLAVDLALYLPALCVLAGWALLRNWRAPRACDWLLAAGLLASALGRAHPGGNDNVRLPAFALLVLVASAAAGELAAVWGERPKRGWLLAAAVSVQAAMLFQPPSLFHPRPAVARGFERLRAELQRCAAAGGGVAPDHSGVIGAAFIHTMAWNDLRGDVALARRAEAALKRGLSGASAPGAVALSEISAPLSELMRGQYSYCSDVPALLLVTGFSPGPTRIFRRSPQR